MAKKNSVGMEYCKKENHYPWIAAAWSVIAINRKFSILTVFIFRRWKRFYVLNAQFHKHLTKIIEITYHSNAHSRSLLKKTYFLWDRLCTQISLESKTSRQRFVYLPFVIVLIEHRFKTYYVHIIINTFLLYTVDLRYNN